jgi:1-deoxy-D-xylulose-5-phosphate synthase
MLRLGVPDAFVEQGSQAQLRQRIGLDCDGLVQKILEFITQLEPQGLPASGGAV